MYRSAGYLAGRSAVGNYVNLAQMNPPLGTMHSLNGLGATDDPKAYERLLMFALGLAQRTPTEQRVGTLVQQVEKLTAAKRSRARTLACEAVVSARAGGVPLEVVQKLARAARGDLNAAQQKYLMNIAFLVTNPRLTNFEGAADQVLRDDNPMVLARRAAAIRQEVVTQARDGKVELGRAAQIAFEMANPQKYPPKDLAMTAWLCAQIQTSTAASPPPPPPPPPAPEREDVPPPPPPPTPESGGAADWMLDELDQDVSAPVEPALGPVDPVPPPPIDPGGAPPADREPLMPPVDMAPTGPVETWRDPGLPDPEEKKFPVVPVVAGVAGVVGLALLVRRMRD